MTTSNLPPNLATELAKLKMRLDAIERKLNAPDSPFKPEIVFSYSGALAAGTSPVWTRRSQGRMLAVVAHLRVAGTTDTVVDVYKNDNVAVTVTIPADETWVTVPCSVTYHPDQDRLYDTITSAGSGAEDLTVQHRFKS